ncbi:Acetoacetyl-CoA reductase [Serendipita sp. 396]|nr:Acetoacetyl-CoA reductase [Serendipita sp. 396]KAG8789338.1 Acetoacetyl-CoA reductase [Serendipita sp. 397]KAG8804572.1 Acetoacetyl-CoA reductase [Serendipita sp. 398]KAG8825215.1 Acetoacetyl-CoA reductase [Serendipita sp. 401]KAG8878693.1 Acetoacetyl-CoA reductase [Serendipita sp. 405]KAG9056228.1 Acetoacetyl-CoA reductase [Serendipita sp. 407]
MPVWLITGASKGIGLGFVQALALDPENAVLATCRTPAEATELQAIATASEDLINVVQLDHEKPESCQQAATEAEDLLGELPIDYIINNAAFHPGHAPLASVSLPLFERTLVSNVVGPTLVYQTFHRFLMKSDRPVVANISSGAGSIGMDLGPSAGAYSVSKAALNMLTYKLARENPKAIIVSISPGWVKTEMGGPGAQIEVADSVKSMLRLIQGLRPEDSGLFLNREGKPLPY